MDIQATKIELIQLVLNTEKEKVLQQIKDILNQDYQSKLAQYNKELEEADKDIEDGNFLTQAEVEKMAKEW